MIKNDSMYLNSNYSIQILCENEHSEETFNFAKRNMKFPVFSNCICAAKTPTTFYVRLFRNESDSECVAITECEHLGTIAFSLLNRGMEAGPYIFELAMHEENILFVCVHDKDNNVCEQKVFEWKA